QLSAEAHAHDVHRRRTRAHSLGRRRKRDGRHAGRRGRVDRRVSQPPLRCLAAARPSAKSHPAISHSPPASRASSTPGPYIFTSPNTSDNAGGWLTTVGTKVSDQ